MLTGEGLDEHVNTLVTVLVSTGGKEVESVLKVEVVMTVEMSSDEVVDFGLGEGVHVLELVHGRELGHVKTVGDDTIYIEQRNMTMQTVSDPNHTRCPTMSAHAAVKTNLAFA